MESEKSLLSNLNKKFIANFVNQDASEHDKIIHQDFVCIESNGKIVEREEYLKNWTTGYVNSGYQTFSIIDEVIRIFGQMAIIRSKTIYTKLKDGEIVNGNSVYTDTYVKTNGKWLCVQAQITPLTYKFS
ncbi:MAG: nuclear transport factor 2 family protein [Mucilaginibacter sp.]